MLERDIEQPFVKWCKAIGLKLKKKNFADQLDRWVMLPGGRPLIIEFKVPGKHPTPLQQREIEELKELGYAVEVCNDVEKAKDAVERLLRSGRIVLALDAPCVSEECAEILARARRLKTPKLRRKNRG